MILENPDLSVKAKASIHFATFDQLRNKNTFFNVKGTQMINLQPCP
jgi:hypothetical protein